MKPSHPAFRGAPLVACLATSLVLGVVASGFLLGRFRLFPPKSQLVTVDKTFRGWRAQHANTPAEQGRCEAHGGTLVGGVRPNEAYCFMPRCTEAGTVVNP